jgi:hypothetical protein
MKTAIKVLAMFAVLGLVGMAWAADQTAPKPVRGEIKEITKDTTSSAVTAIVLTVKTDAGTSDVTYKVNDKTAVKIGDKDAKAADLKAKMIAYVVADADKVALKIMARPVTTEHGK